MESNVVKNDGIDTLARAFTDALQAKDFERIKQIMHPDFEIYLQFSGEHYQSDEACKYIAGLIEGINFIEYSAIRITPTSKGYVQQHLVTADLKSGIKSNQVPVCMVVIVENDKIRCVEEYLNFASVSS